MTRGNKKRGTIIFDKQEEKQEKGTRTELQDHNKKKGTCFKPSSPQL